MTARSAALQSRPEAGVAPRWLADTKVLLHAIRFPVGDVAQRIQHLTASSPGALCTSVVVACEMHFGAKRVSSARLREKIDTLLDFIPTLPLDRLIVEHYAALRTHLTAAGTPIGPNDTLIAAHALALDAILVTDNEEKFRRVPGLQVENWLR